MLNPLLALVLIAAALAGVVFLVLALFSGLFRKVGPNQALIVYGLGGTHVVKGGGALVLPVLQTYREFSLELMSFDVAPTQDLYTRQGVAVNVEAVAQIKVKSDRDSILTAAEQFLSKKPEEREGLIRLVMEGHLRGIVGQLAVEEIVKQPEMVSERMRANVAEDMGKMGLEVVSFTIREVRDKNQYIENMGKPDIVRIKRDADIAAAEAQRDTAIRQAETMREAAIARAQAEQEKTIAETASAARQAEAQRDLALKQAAFLAETKRAQAEADKAYELQTNVMQQQVVLEAVKVQRVEKEEQVKVQEAEIARREKELAATVLKAAEAERRRIETLAEAERQRLVLEAQGRAEATRAQGQAQADITRLQGTAEAEIIEAKGKAEAGAMSLKAGAYREYTQAAVLDKLLSGLPELARAFAEPLAKVDRITVVSTGDGNGALGTSQITRDLARMIAQAPALFETLTGMKVADLLGRLPAVGQATGDGSLSDGASSRHETAE